MQGLITILFKPRETLPTEISREAQLLGLTDTEFVKRLVVDGLERLDAGEPAEPGQTPEYAAFWYEMERSTQKSRARYFIASEKRCD